MSSITNEFKVGLFVIVAVGLAIFAWVWTMDTVRPGEASYDVSLLVPDASGLWEGSQVRTAGVQVGAISDVAVEGNQARLILTIREAYQFPVDSEAQLKSSGMLGDMFIQIIPGREDPIIPDGGRLELAEQPGDLDVITRQVEDISDDIRAITSVLREVVENDANREHLEATLANVDALSLEVRLMAEQNRSDIGAIVDSVRRLSESLETISKETGRDVDEEMEKIKEVTDKLDRAAADIESITSKVDGGQGTIGALVNDDETIDAINDTVDNANQVIEGFSGLRAEVFYIGRYYMGTQPRDTDTFFYGNPLAWSASNNLGMYLKSSEDFWYLFAVHDYPQGTITYEERFVPETGSVVTEWIRQPNYRFTFQIAKRWHDVGFRLGVKEGGGGIGVTWYTLNDKLEVNADAFDFSFGPYPAVQDSGIPNVRLAARYEPINHVWLEAGGEQLVLGAKYGYATGFLGAGFHFTDDDIKLLFATLPLGF